MAFTEWMLKLVHYCNSSWCQLPLYLKLGPVLNWEKFYIVHQAGDISNPTSDWGYFILYCKTGASSQFTIIIEYFIYSIS